MHVAQLHARNPSGLMAEQRDDFPAVHDGQNHYYVVLLDAVADNVIVRGAPFGRVADSRNCPAGGKRLRNGHLGSVAMRHLSKPY